MGASRLRRLSKVVPEGNLPIRFVCLTSCDVEAVLLQTDRLSLPDAQRWAPDEKILFWSSLISRGDLG